MTLLEVEAGANVVAGRSNPFGTGLCSSENKACSAAGSARGLATDSLEGSAAADFVAGGLAGWAVGMGAGCLAGFLVGSALGSSVELLVGVSFGLLVGCICPAGGGLCRGRGGGAGALLPGLSLDTLPLVSGADGPCSGAVTSEAAGLMCAAALHSYKGCRQQH